MAKGAASQSSGSGLSTRGNGLGSGLSTHVHGQRSTAPAPVSYAPIRYMIHFPRNANWRLHQYSRVVEWVARGTCPCRGQVYSSICLYIVSTSDVLHTFHLFFVHHEASMCKIQPQPLDRTQHRVDNPTVAEWFDNPTVEEGAD